MTTPTEPPRRRRRRRATAPQGAVRPAAAAPADPEPQTAKPRAARTPPPTPAVPPTPSGESAKPRKRRPSAREAGQDRALRDLVGAGHSQLSPSAALRARDVNRPTAEDLRIAEQEVEIVRRDWKPNAG